MGKLALAQAFVALKRRVKGKAFWVEIFAGRKSPTIKA